MGNRQKSATAGLGPGPVHSLHTTCWDFVPGGALCPRVRGPSAPRQASQPQPLLRQRSFTVLLVQDSGSGGLLPPCRTVPTGVRPIWSPTPTGPVCEPIQQTTSPVLRHETRSASGGHKRPSTDVAHDEGPLRKSVVVPHRGVLAKAVRRRSDRPDGLAGVAGAALVGDVSPDVGRASPLPQRGDVRVPAGAPPAPTTLEGGGRPDQRAGAADLAVALTGIQKLETLYDIPYADKLRMLRSAVDRYPALAGEAVRTAARLKRFHSHPRYQVFYEIQPLLDW